MVEKVKVQRLIEDFYRKIVLYLTSLYHYNNKQSGVSSDLACKGGFPVMAETTRKLAASTR